jgi:biopolymer transport protein ExbB/TolQ
MASNGKSLALCGTILQIGIVFGFVGTVVGMMRAFAKISETEKVQPATVAAEISIVFQATSIGMALAFVGFILILIALTGTKYRGRWFYRILWTISILWLLFFPIGTIVGIMTMLYLSRHSQEFK